MHDNHPVFSHSLLKYGCICKSTHCNTLYMYMCVYTAAASQDRSAALHKASEGGHTGTVTELLRRGVDPNVSNRVSSMYMYMYMYVNTN